MINALRRFGSACLATALVAAPAAGQMYPWNYVGAPCGGYGVHVSPPPLQGYRRVRLDEGYRRQVLPSVVGGRSTTRAQAELYSPEEKQVLFHPVIVPLDEFLSPAEPVALSPEELARRRAAAAARARPPQPQLGVIPPAGPPEEATDPFADDAATTDEPADVPTEEPAERAEEDAFADEDMPAEEPGPAEAESPEAEMPLESELTDAEEDPFSDIQ